MVNSVQLFLSFLKYVIARKVLIQSLYELRQLNETEMWQQQLKQGNRTRYGSDFSGNVT